MALIAVPAVAVLGPAALLLDSLGRLKRRSRWSGRARTQPPRATIQILNYEGRECLQAVEARRQSEAARLEAIAEVNRSLSEQMLATRMGIVNTPAISTGNFIQPRSPELAGPSLRHRRWRLEVAPPR
jgi:hypothetical protein